MSKTEEIRSVLDEVRSAFSDLDFDRWLNCFHSPRTIVQPKGVFCSSSYEESRTALLPMFDSLKERGFKRTQLDLCNIKLLGDTRALASTVWTRFNSSEEVMERLGATYMFLLADGRWKIVVLTGHSADVVAVSE